MNREKLLFSNIDGENCIREKRIFSVEVTETGNDNLHDENLEDIHEKLEFTTVADITSRLKMLRLPSRVRFSKLLLVYKMFYKHKSPNLDVEELKFIQQLFLSDLMTIFNTIAADVVAGGRVNVLLGTAGVDKKIDEAARLLAIPYSKLLKASAATGWEPKTIREKANVAFESFTTACKAFVFESEVQPSVIEKEAAKVLN